jgi:hypothetical protein
VTSPRCYGAWPARATSRGFVMVGCGGRDRGPLTGVGIVPTAESIAQGVPAPIQGFPAAAEVAAPPGDSCWVLTKVVLHYHVGWRYYAASDPYELIVCAPDARSQLDAAMKAAEVTR